MEYLICLKVFGYIQQIDLYPPGYIIFYIIILIYWFVYSDPHIFYMENYVIKS